MNIQKQIETLIPSGFPENSRVWVYQSNRPFSEQQSIEISEQLEQFYLQWMVHGKEVKGWAGLLFNRFIVLMADESQNEVSGCSIDSSVRILKSLERQYDAKLFDRLSITFLVKEKAEVLPMNQVQYAIDKGYINGDTLLFNNLVETKKDLLENWLQPLAKSWMSRQINFENV